MSSEPMQNIDIVFILQPIIIIMVSSGLVVYWHYKRSFRKVVLLYSFAAYFAAIALKDVVQIPTLSLVVNYFGAQSVGVGVYYGLQTVVFEVGGAFFVAWYAVSRGKFDRKDAEAFGLGLGFWENAVLLGLFSLVSLVAYYTILSTNTSTAQTIYSQLNVSAPGLFSPLPQAFESVAFGVVERISSILFHFSWGYLCVMAACLHKKQYLMLALPMGFIDFLVPFAPSLGLAVFEALVFALSVASVAVAWYTTRKLRRKADASDLQ